MEQRWLRWNCDSRLIDWMAERDDEGWRRVAAQPGVRTFGKKGVAIDFLFERDAAEHQKRRVC